MSSTIALRSRNSYGDSGNRMRHVSGDETATGVPLLLTTLARYLGEVVKSFLRYVDYFSPSSNLLWIKERIFLGSLFNYICIIFFPGEQSNVKE